MSSNGKSSYNSKPSDSLGYPTLNKFLGDALLPGLDSSRRSARPRPQPSRTAEVDRTETAIWDEALSPIFMRCGKVLSLTETLNRLSSSNLDNNNSFSTQLLLK